MLRYVAAYLASGLVFVAADAVWLLVAGPRLYRPILGPLLAPKPEIKAAVVFYLLYLTGVLVLTIAPAMKGRSWWEPALAGLALGLVAYGTYDLTNQATLRVWSTRLTLADMGWGGALTAVAALAGWAAARRIA